jgi:uncharacterized protein
MSFITDILRDNRVFAVVGVSQNKDKYGYEVFETLRKKDYVTYPVNPKYERIDDLHCFSSLENLPEKPEVVVTVVPPAVTEKVVETCARQGITTIWMPHGSWSEQSVASCEQHGIQVVHDVCLVFALRSLKE